MTITDPDRPSRSIRFKPHRGIVSHLRSVVLTSTKDFLITLGDGIDHRDEATKTNAAAAAAMGEHEVKAYYDDIKEDEKEEEEENEPSSFVYVTSNHRSFTHL